MKKTLIAVMTISVLAISCSEKTVVEANQNVVNQISFDRINTKVEVTEASQIGEFGVFAEQNLGGAGTADAANFISLLSNERVYRNEESEFIYDQKRYWMDNRTFRFFAYHPYLADGATASEGVTSVTPVRDAAGFPDIDITFVTPDQADADLVVANNVTTIDSDPETEYPTVDFLFSHAVSKVSLQVAKHNKNKDNKIEITSVEFSGIAKSATYNALTNEWSEHGDMLSLKAEDITLGKDDILFHDVFSGMFIPQDINLNMKSIFVKIAYDFFTSNESGEWIKDEDSYTATSYLPVGTWEPSKSYVYKLTLSSVDNTISFKSPDVASWGTPNPAGTLIIQ